MGGTARHNHIHVRCWLGHSRLWRLGYHVIAMQSHDRNVNTTVTNGFAFQIISKVKTCLFFDPSAEKFRRNRMKNVSRMYEFLTIYVVSKVLSLQDWMLKAKSLTTFNQHLNVLGIFFWNFRKNFYTNFCWNFYKCIPSLSLQTYEPPLPSSADKRFPEIDWLTAGFLANIGFSKALWFKKWVTPVRDAPYR